MTTTPSSVRSEGFVQRLRDRLAPAFDSTGGRRLDAVLVNLLIVGYLVLFLIGAFEAIARPLPGTWVQPIGTLGFMAWAVSMQIRRRPRPVRLLVVSATIASAYLVGASVAGSVGDVTNTSPVVMLVGAGAIALVAGGRHAPRTATFFAVLLAITVIAVQTALGEHPVSIVAETASALVVVGLAYYLVRSVRVAFDTGSTRYEGLVETAPVAVLEANLANARRRLPVVQHLNERAREILGIIESGRIDEQLVAPHFQQLIGDLLSGDSPTGERVMQLGNGRWLLVNWRALDRSLERVIFSGVDVTAQLEAERSLEQQIRARDTFVATVSHELRTPLTATLGLLELLADDAVPENERAELLHMALTQTRDMADIVQDLLVAARASGGSLVIKPEPVELRSLSELVLAAVDEDFELMVATDAWSLADPMRVRQIVRNLVTNAVRYGGPTRRIRIDRSGDFALLEVCDDGPPLDAELQQRMFEPYERSSGGQLPTESVGLGLTVARMLAELMGGDLRYRHNGFDSMFTLRIPLADTPAEATCDTRAGEEGVAGGVHDDSTVGFAGHRPQT